LIDETQTCIVGLKPQQRRWDVDVAGVEILHGQRADASGAGELGVQ
jgi:hypothetical protein